MTTDRDEIVPSTELEAGDSPFAKLIEYARSIEPEDDEAVQRRILDGILRADNPTDLLNAGGSVPAEQVLNMPMTVLAIRAAESSFTEGAPMYLHVDAKFLGNGDAITFSTGASDVIAKLLKADMEGWLPQDIVLYRRDKATKAGYFPIFARAVTDQERPF